MLPIYTFGIILPVASLPSSPHFAELFLYFLSSPSSRLEECRKIHVKSTVLTKQLEISCLSLDCVDGKE